MTIDPTAPAVLRRLRHGILTLTLNRPHRLNAIDEHLSRALGEALHEADSSPEVRVVVIHGAGRAFCAGMDLDSFMSDEPIEHPDHPDWGVAGITRQDVSVPVVAAVHGVAAGGGFEVALCADVIIAEESTRFALPEVRLGLFAAAGGLVRLPARLPRNLVNELALTGRWSTAQELAAHGVVNQVVPDGTCLEGAMAVAGQIAGNGPGAVRATKRILALSGGGHGDEDVWTVNQRLMADHFASAEAQEGVQAFKAGRTPSWAAPGAQ